MSRLVTGTRVVEIRTQMHGLPRPNHVNTYVTGAFIIGPAGKKQGGRFEDKFKPRYGQHIDKLGTDCYTRDMSDGRRRAPSINQWDLFLRMAREVVASDERLAALFSGKKSRAGRAAEKIARETSLLFRFPDETVFFLPFPFDIALKEIWRDLGKATEDKLKIADYVIKKELIRYERIFLDSGSTVLTLAVKLYLDEGGLPSVQIVTNNLHTLFLAIRVDDFELVGGKIVGKNRIAKSAAYSFDLEKPIVKSFMSVYGISSDNGAYCEESLARTKREVIEATKHRIYFLAHGDKIGETGEGIPYFSFDELDELEKDYRIITTEPKANVGAFEDERQRFMERFGGQFQERFRVVD